MSTWSYSMRPKHLTKFSMINSSSFPSKRCASTGNSIALNMCMMSSFIVGWRDESSEQLMLLNGVKQGGVLSPLLFPMYLDPLLERRHQTKYGCRIGNLSASAFAYTDDMVIISPTCCANSICMSYIQINLAWTLILINVYSYFLHLNHFYNNVKITMSGRPINIVKHEKHPGHLLQCQIMLW